MGENRYITDEELSQIEPTCEPYNRPYEDLLDIRKLTKIEKLRKSADDLSYDIKYLDIIDFSVDDASNLLNKADRLMVALRALCEFTCEENIKKEELLSKTKDLESGIKVDRVSGFLRITLPLLLPKRNYNSRSKYMVDWIKSELEKSEEIKNYKKNCSDKKSIICYVNCYDYDTADRKIWKDNDNVEQKWMTDIISDVALISDRPNYLDVFITSKVIAGFEPNHTEIFLFVDNQIEAFYQKILKGYWEEYYKFSD